MLVGRKKATALKKIYEAMFFIPLRWQPNPNKLKLKSKLNFERDRRVFPFAGFVFAEVTRLLTEFFEEKSCGRQFAWTIWINIMSVHTIPLVTPFIRGPRFPYRKSEYERNFL